MPMLLVFFVTSKCEKPQKNGEQNGENWRKYMKFLGQIQHMIILKITKYQDFSESVKNTNTSNFRILGPSAILGYSKWVPILKKMV